jgi:hypothetical protein
MWPFCSASQPSLEISLLGLVPDLPADNRKPGVKIVASKRRG